MAEEDWYGPFGKLTQRHLVLFVGVTGGLLWIVSGVVGYDQGRRYYTATVPAETRWMGHVLWDQICIGLAFFAYSYFWFWKHARQQYVNPPSYSAAVGRAGVDTWRVQDSLLGGLILLGMTAFCFGFSCGSV
jgi:hypothetical protein